MAILGIILAVILGILAAFTLSCFAVGILYETKRWNAKRHGRDFSPWDD